MSMSYQIWNLSTSVIAFTVRLMIDGIFVQVSTTIAVAAELLPFRTCELIQIEHRGHYFDWSADVCAPSLSADAAQERQEDGLCGSTVQLEDSIDQWLLNHNIACAQTPSEIARWVHGSTNYHTLQSQFCIPFYRRLSSKESMSRRVEIPL